MKPSSRKRRPTSSAVDWNAVGRRTRTLRGFDLTQEEFATRIAISQTYVSEMEMRLGLKSCYGLLVSSARQWSGYSLEKTRDKSAVGLSCFQPRLPMFAAFVFDGIAIGKFEPWLQTCKKADRELCATSLHF